MNVVHWLFAAQRWSGPDGIPTRAFEHLQLSGGGLVLALALALPAGVVVGHTRRGAGVAVSVANAGRSVPSFAVLVLSFIAILRLAPKLAFGFGPTVIALALLAIPPILTNTIVAVQGVDADAVDAARGMGLTGGGVLRQLELPLAAPLIVTGIRIAALQVVATATLAAVIAGGGLGRYIVDGFAAGDRTMALGGAILVAALAIVLELAFGLLARAVAPRTTSRATRLGPSDRDGPDGEP